METVRQAAGDHLAAAEVRTRLGEDHVAEVVFSRPPNNFFDIGLVAAIADALDELAATSCRAVVLASEGKHFCAGASLQPGGNGQSANALYEQAMRIFEQPLPLVAAVQGSATGGGAGLALAADFRVAAATSRFWINFSRLGFHPGFGLSVTLPRLVGPQRAQEIFYTGRKVAGDEALAIGLCDRVAEPERVRAEAHELAAEIAASAPLAVRAIRATLRGALLEEVRAMVEHEASEQARLRSTADWAEGVAAVAERREPNFRGA